MLKFEEHMQLDSLILHAAQASAGNVAQLSQESASERRIGAALALHLSALHALQTSVLAPTAGRPVFMQQITTMFRQVTA